MLESPRLWVHHWGYRADARGQVDSRDQGSDRRRLITDPTSSTPLGFVSKGDPSFFSWRRWLYPGQLEIHEMVDDALLARVCWLWDLAGTREVVDADAKMVGTLISTPLGWPRWFNRGHEIPSTHPHWRTSRGTLALNRFGQVFALIEGAHAKTGQFLNTDGFSMGTFSRLPTGTLLEFFPKPENNPFAKMILLAGVISDEKTSRHDSRKS